MAGLFGAKAAKPLRVEIARIESHPVPGGAASFAALMLLIGFALMLFGLTDNSAIRLAAYAAIWTGWNALWGAVLISNRRRVLVVTREQQTAEGGSDSHVRGS
jgi:hypothetical protein